MNHILKTINEHILNQSKFKYVILTKEEYKNYYDFAKEQIEQFNNPKL